jgi:hypothetical protein
LTESIYFADEAWFDFIMANRRNIYTGREVIDLFKKYNSIDYIVSCYDALHTMGGFAIAEDIDILIGGMKG